MRKPTCRYCGWRESIGGDPAAGVFLCAPCTLLAVKRKGCLHPEQDDDQGRPMPCAWPRCPMGHFGPRWFTVKVPPMRLKDYLSSAPPTTSRVEQTEWERKQIVDDAAPGLILYAWKKGSTR